MKIKMTVLLFPNKKNFRRDLLSKMWIGRNLCYRQTPANTPRLVFILRARTTKSRHFSLWWHVYFFVCDSLESGKVFFRIIPIIVATKWFDQPHFGPSLIARFCFPTMGLRQNVRWLPREQTRTWISNRPNIIWNMDGKENSTSTTKSFSGGIQKSDICNGEVGCDFRPFWTQRKEIIPIRGDYYACVHQSSNHKLICTTTICTQSSILNIFLSRNRTVWAPTLTFQLR